SLLRGGFDVRFERGGGAAQARSQIGDARWRRRWLEWRRRLRTLLESPRLQGRLQEEDTNQRPQRTWRRTSREFAVEDRARDLVRDRDVLGHLAGRPLSRRARRGPCRWSHGPRCRDERVNGF